MRGGELCPTKSLNQLSLSHAAALGGSEEWQSWEIPCCRTWSPLSADLTCCLGSLLLARGLNPGHCEETAKTCLALGLLCPATLPHGHQQYQGRPVACQATWLQEQGSGTVFPWSLMLQVKGLRRSRHVRRVNNSLHSRWQQKRFDFYYHGKVFEDQGLLGRDRIHLFKQGKSIASRLVRRTLK